MGRIQKLDDEVIQRIAAGEVIQRPANAVKELLENSLDAGATSISVQVQDGGFKTLVIQDNGHGIMREDLAMLCERYATSKLHQAEDLKSISTFGFRGEALASISHISRLSVVTKTADSQLGFKASFLNGTLMGVPEPVAANQGTLITIQDLFYNNRVRLESANKADEYLRILDVVQKYAIDNVGKCGFACKKQQSPADLTTRAIPDVTSDFAAHIDVIRMVYGSKQKSFIFILFINGRLVESGRLRKAIAAVYAEVLLTQTHPFVYLSLSIPAHTLDVNVHPTKKEVIFLNEDAIVSSIAETIKSTLAESGAVNVQIPSVKPPNPMTEASPRVTMIDSQPKTPSSAPMPSYPFQQVHSDHRTRTLESFVYHKKPKTEPVASGNPFVVNNVKEVPTKLLVAGKETDKDTNKDPLRNDLNLHADSLLTECLQKSILVGFLSDERVFLQFETALLLVHMPSIVQSHIHQKLIFDDFVLRRGLSMDMDHLLTCFMPSEIKQDPSIDQKAFLKECYQFLRENQDAFTRVGIEFEFNAVGGKVSAVPEVFWTPAEWSWDTVLGNTIFRVICSPDVNDSANISKVLSVLLTVLVEEFTSHLWSFLTQDDITHVIMPAIKSLPKDSRGYHKNLMKNGSLIKLTTTHDLYKIFERC